MKYLFRYIVCFSLLLFNLQSQAQSNKIKDVDKVLKENKMKIDTNVVNSFINIADSLMTTDTLKAINYAKKARDLAQQLSYEKGVGMAHMTMGNIEKQKNNFPQALNHYILARDIFAQIGAAKLEARNINKIGVIYQKSSNYPQALKHFKKAANKFEDIDKESYPGTLNNIGLAYFMQSNYGEAIVYLRKSLDIRKELGDKTGMAGNFNNIGNIYYLQSNYEAAFEHYRKSLEIKREMGDSANLANSYINIASIYKFRNKYDSALVYLQEAVDINKSLQNESGLTVAIINTGDLLYEMDEVDQALSYYRRAYQKAVTIDSKANKMHALFGMGLCYSKKKNYATSIDYLNQALDLAKNVHMEKVKEIYQSLSSVYEQAGNYKQSLLYYRKYNNLQDSLTSLKNEKQLAEAEAKYKVEQKQKEIDFLQKENAIKELKLEKNQLVTYAFGISLFLLLLILAIIYLNNRQKQKRNKLLSEKNESIKKQKEEKEVLLKEIHHRVKNNLQVIISLLRLQSSFSDDNRVKKLFEESENRVLSMSLIHEKLYQSKDLSKIKIAEYINELIQNLIDTYRLDLDIDLKTEIDDISFDVNTLIPVGLLLNEIISNSLKYAFEGREKGMIVVSLKKTPDAEKDYELIVGDNGIGLPEEKLKEVSSLGLELIDTFVEQLNGKQELLDKKGTYYRIVF